MAARVQGGKRLAEFLRRAKAAQRRSKGVDVGFFKTARYSPVRQGVRGGQARVPHFVATVAAWNEFGVPSRGIPERPFLRNAVDGADRELVPILKAGIDPKTMELTDQVAGLLGEVMKARAQRSIVQLREPPNAPATIRRKRSSNPLVDEGVLHGSVSYAVVDP